MPFASTKTKHRTHCVVGIVFMIIWLAFISSSEDLFISFDDRMQGLINLIDREKPKAPAVAVVDIDDMSLLNVGQWPWPRYVLGNLIRAVKRDPKQVVGLDILLSENDRSSLGYIKQRYKMEFNIDMFVVGVPDNMQDNDAYLAKVLRDESRIVGAIQLDVQQQPDEGYFHSPYDNDLTLPYADAVLRNIPVIRSALSRSGFVNFFNEGDGVLRNIPMLSNSAEGLIPSFALAMLMEREGVDKINIEKNFWGRVIHVGKYHIPIDNQGKSWLNASAAENNYTTTSAADILTGQSRIPANRLVLIGSSSAALHDRVIMPLQRNVAGVGVHALALNNMINNQLIIHPSWTLYWNVITSIILLLIINKLYFLPIGVARRTGMVLASIVLLSVVMVCAFHFYKVWLSVIPAVLGGLCLTILSELAEYLLLRKNMNIWKEDLEHSNHAMLHAMASLCDSRDPETGGHTNRTQYYVKCLADALSHYHQEAQHPFFVDTLFHAALLHDVGKVAIPDSILLKPGALTDEEFSVIKTHTTIGRQILMDTADKLRTPSDFLHCAIDMAGSHHERWDGKGYPDRLSGTQIPFCARVMAVADVYDALTSKRVYKKSMSHEKAVAIITESAGTQFDPSVVNAFLGCEYKIMQICNQFIIEHEHSS